jgi:Ca2+-binding RTX toxin-like protein
MAFIFGTNGNDLRVGTIFNDVMFGGPPFGPGVGLGLGNDTLGGFFGNDTIYGGRGRDLLNGGVGDDDIYGGDGNDVLNGSGVVGPDFAGDDFLQGWFGNDTAKGGWGDDYIEGNAGNDRLYGDQGYDYVEGGLGNDRVYGGDGDDTVVGGNLNLFAPDFGGKDKLYGDAGDDLLRGGYGNDTLEGGKGQDTLKGGFDKDVFLFKEGDSTIFGPDTISPDQGTFAFGLLQDKIKIDIDGLNDFIGWQPFGGGDGDVWTVNANPFDPNSDTWVLGNNDEVPGPPTFKIVIEDGFIQPWQYSDSNFLFV